MIGVCFDNTSLLVLTLMSRLRIQNIGTLGEKSDHAMIGKINLLTIAAR